MAGISGLPMFFGWVRLFVAHFLGKRNLEVYTARLALVKLNKRPEIKVFAVGSDVYQMPSWEDFKTVIRNALVDSPEEETAKIIENLREKAIHGKGLNSDAQRALSFLRNVILGNQDRTTCILRMHCEAVVATALLPLPEESSTDRSYDILVKFSQVLGLVPECENFHSCFPRAWPTIWFQFQNYAALSVGNFSKFSRRKA
jgi:hypothetical protein